MQVGGGGGRRSRGGSLILFCMPRQPPYPTWLFTPPFCGLWSQDLFGHEFIGSRCPQPKWEWISERGSLRGANLLK